MGNMKKEKNTNENIEEIFLVVYVSYNHGGLKLTTIVD
jgi:hypothetical protein